MSKYLKEFFKGLGSVLLVVPARRSYPSRARRSGFSEDRQRLAGDVLRVTSDLRRSIARAREVYRVK